MRRNKQQAPKSLLDTPAVQIPAAGGLERTVGGDV